jgi:hypothetical protein
VQSRWIAEGRKLAPHVGAVAWRLLVAVAALELVYLLAANVVLKTSLLKDFAARGDDLKLDYDSAYSVLPGRIHVERLRVRFHDRNVEFLIGVERGTLDVSLHELAMKRFHALRVDGSAVSYRMRHKVSRVGKEGPRLAAYPPIPGFADPPLYAKGEDRPSPPIPEEEYDLWEVKVEGVRAEVAEVWILEYRYRGPGLATGSFHVRPALTYEVPHATLDVRGGTLTLGETIVSKQATLAIDCVVTHSETQKLVGLEPVRRVRAGVRGRLEGMDVAFLDAYLAPRLGARADGRSRLDIDLRVEHGIVTPGSKVELSVPEARLGVGDRAVTGAATLRLARSKGATADTPFEVGLRSDRLELAVGEARGMHVENLELAAAFTPDLTRPVRMVRASLAPLRVEVEELHALERALPSARKLPRVGGSAVLVVRGSKEGAGPIRGGFRLELSDATLAVDGARTLPWNGLLVSDDVVGHVEESPAAASGTLSLHVDRAGALLPLVSSSPLVRDLEERLLRLGALDAKAKLELGERVRFELLQARAGIARARGYVVDRKDGARGRFLVSTPAGNVGVIISPAGTDTELLVGDDWLTAARSGVLRRPERGGLSQGTGNSSNNSGAGGTARRLQ